MQLTMRRVRHGAGFAVLCALLAACGHGGAGSLPVAPPSGDQLGHGSGLSRIALSHADAVELAKRVVRSGAHALAPHDGTGKPLGRVLRPQSGDPRALTNYGGPTVPNAMSYNLYVNCAASCWGTPSTFLTNLANSTMIHLVDQYVNVSAEIRYSYGSSIAVSYPAGTLHDSDVYAIVHQAAASLGTGYGVVYHVFVPQGTDVCSSAAGGCYSPDQPAQWTFCAYHGNTDFSDIGHVLYSVEPYQNVSGTYNGQQLSCQAQYAPNGQVVDATASTLSHELFETITDPDVPNHLAWYNQSYGEIGDICRFTPTGGPVTINGVSYGLQKEYSNADQDCVFGAPAWRATGGYAVDVGATNGTTWAVPSDGSLWYQTNSGWNKTNGASATKVEVSPNGNAWAILSDESIWHYASGYWQKIGGLGVDIAAGADDNPWLIGADGLTPFHYVNGNWQQLPGQFTRITASPENVAYAIAPDKQIWKYDPGSNSWIHVACCADDIGVGANGNLWVIGDGNAIWHWNGGSSWTQWPGTGTSIAVTPNGTPYVTEAGTSAVKYYK